MDPQTAALPQMMGQQHRGEREQPEGGKPRDCYAGFVTCILKLLETLGLLKKYVESSFLGSVKSRLHVCQWAVFQFSHKLLNGN